MFLTNLTDLACLDIAAWAFETLGFFLQTTVIIAATATSKYTGLQKRKEKRYKCLSKVTIHCISRNYEGIKQKYITSQALKLS